MYAYLLRSVAVRRDGASVVASPRLWAFGAALGPVVATICVLMYAYLFRSVVVWRRFWAVDAADGRSAPLLGVLRRGGMIGSASGVRRPATRLDCGRRRGGRSAGGVDAVAARRWASARWQLGDGGGLTEEISLHGRNCMEGNQVID
ncbi:hypothetical protein GUJ93_ZPchr0001g29867 [Zizania palustris]|uniref:Uncharacterized protein n=1 Tax=Zizania palustris TaxID=103762 RepID=A0A8J5S9B2_ZIZPA|nr:hypothetical protein GUJ93_ZPchr0001g29867 [Zizania palustris]